MTKVRADVDPLLHADLDERVEVPGRYLRMDVGTCGWAGRDAEITEEAAKRKCGKIAVAILDDMIEIDAETRFFRCVRRNIFKHRLD